MISNLGDLPKVIDNLIKGIIIFFYRMLATFATIIRAPRFGGIRAYSSQRFLEPLTTLFIASGLVALFSMVMPEQAAGLLRRNQSDLLSWLFFTIVLFLLVDATINFGVMIAWRRGRRRRRAVALLRYAAAAMLSVWSMSAALHRITDNTMIEGFALQIPDWMTAALKSDWFSWFVLLLAFMPIVGNSWLLLTGRSSTPSRLRRAAVLLMTTLAFFGLSRARLPQLLGNLDYAWRNVQIPPEARPNALRVPERAIVSPAVEICDVAPSGSGIFSAGLLNGTDRPVIMDGRRFEIWAEEQGSDPMDPHYAKVVPVLAEGPIIIVPPRSAQIVRGRFTYSNPEQLSKQFPCTLQLGEAEVLRMEPIEK